MWVCVQAGVSCGQAGMAHGSHDKHEHHRDNAELRAAWCGVTVLAVRTCGS